MTRDRQKTDEEEMKSKGGDERWGDKKSGERSRVKVGREDKEAERGKERR